MSVSALILQPDSQDDYGGKRHEFTAHAIEIRLIPLRLRQDACGKVQMQNGVGHIAEGSFGERGQRSHEERSGSKMHPVWQNQEHSAGGELLGAQLSYHKTMKGRNNGDISFLDIELARRPCS